MKEVVDTVSNEPELIQLFSHTDGVLPLHDWSYMVVMFIWRLQT